MDTLARLEQVILERRKCDPETSYVALLKREGRPMMARKLGEEGVEAVPAGPAASSRRIRPVRMCVIGVENRATSSENAPRTATRPSTTRRA